MSEMTCNCGKPTRDNAYVCEGCLSEFARALGEIPWTVEQLDITLQKAHGIDYTAMGGSPGSESPLPVSYAAYEALTQLRHVLVTWVRFCDEEGIRHQSPSKAYPKDNLVSMSRWLMWRIDGLSLNDLGGDAVSEVTRAVGRARQVIDRPAEKVYAGPCECGRDLYAKPKAKLTTCKACEREYDVEEMQDWMRKGVMGRLVTASEGALLLAKFGMPIPVRSVNRWHETGQVLDHGKNNARPPRHLYLIDDLFAVAARSSKLGA